MIAVLLAVAGLAAAACGDDGTTEPEPLVPSPTLSDIQRVVFTPSCAAFTACHDGNNPAGGLDLREGVAHGNLFNRGSTLVPHRLLVVPGDPAQSFLVTKLHGDLDEDEGEAMPFGNPPLSAEVIAAIEEWIAAGAADD
jgi:hypothetical protein